jgi:putative acetyltransferase
MIETAAGSARGLVCLGRVSVAILPTSCRMIAAPPLISEMTLADYDEVLALWRATENVGLSDADSRSGVQAYLERNAGLSLVTRYDGRLVGAVLCGHDGRRGYLHHLAVAADFRNRGIGRTLVNECLARLAALGIQKCHAWVYHENAAGQAFWERVGWAPRTDLKVMSKHAEDR